MAVKRIMMEGQSTRVEAFRLTADMDLTHIFVSGLMGKQFAYL